MNNRTNNHAGDQSHYEILGVSINADLDSIKKAYKAKAKIYHPDKVPVNYTQDQKKAHEEMFKKVSNAYETLRDPIKKSDYDRLNGFNQPTRPTSSPFFAQSYGSNNSPFGNNYPAARGFGFSHSSPFGFSFDPRSFGFSSNDFYSNSEYFNDSFDNTFHSNDNFNTSSNNYKAYPTNDFNTNNNNNANHQNSEGNGYPNTNYKTSHNNHDGLLKDAIQTDNIEIVKMLLENNVTITNNDLCEAISLKRSAILEILLTKKPLYNFSINQNDTRARRFDLMAILSGDVNILQILERHRLYNFIANHHINTSEWLIYAAYSGSMEMMKYLMRVQNLQHHLHNERVVKQILIAAIDESHVSAKNVDDPSHRVNLLTFLFKDCQLKIATQELRHIIFPLANSKLNFNVYIYLQSQLIKLSNDVNNLEKDKKMYGRFRHLAHDGLDMLSNVKDLFKLYYYLNPTHTAICLQVHNKIQTHRVTPDQLKTIILNEKTDKKRNSLSNACLFYYATNHCNDGLQYIKLLIEELGANVNAQNRHGYLLIHHTYLTSKVDDKFKYLILKGANVYAKDPQNKSIYDVLQYDQAFLDLLKGINGYDYNNNRYHFYDHYNNHKNHNTKYSKNNRFFKDLITDKQHQLRAIDEEIDTMQLFKTQQKK